MPEDGFIWTDSKTDTRDDRTFTLDIGTTEDAFRQLTNTITKEAALDPIQDMTFDDGGFQPGDDFWL